MATKKEYEQLLAEIKKPSRMNEKKFNDTKITFGQLVFYEKYGIRIPSYIYRRFETSNMIKTFYTTAFIYVSILLLILLSEPLLQRMQLHPKQLANEYFVSPYSIALLLFLFVLMIVFLFPKKKSE